MTDFYNRKSSTPLRQELRNHLTNAEVQLWIALKGSKLEGLKFRRQYSIGEYVMDFYCVEVKLGVEVDGDSHDTAEAKVYDERRTKFLTSFGVTIVRVTNPDVYENMDGVWEMLQSVAQ